MAIVKAETSSFLSITLAVIFLIKVCATSQIFSVPKVLGCRFGKDNKLKLRKVEKLQRKVIKNEAAVRFLTACILYKVCFKFQIASAYPPKINIEQFYKNCKEN